MENLEVLMFSPAVGDIEEEPAEAERVRKEVH
jgi:hypothetical protein